MNSENQRKLFSPLQIRVLASGASRCYAAVDAPSFESGQQPERHNGHSL